VNLPGPKKGAAKSWFVEVREAHTAHEETAMSARNGDKSRFHRVRKQRIQLRLRTRAFLQAAGLASGLSTPAGAPKPSRSRTKNE